MKVVFNCGLYDFHRDYYVNIAEELERRGHIVDFSKDRYIEDADFTITADEAQISMGGKCMWIGHSFDAKGAMWNDPHYLDILKENADYAFVYSEGYKKWLSKYFDKPIYITGMAKLDNLFGSHGDKILYAPTFDDTLSADYVLGEALHVLEKMGDVIIRRHPALYDNNITLDDALKMSKIVISGYSSVGMESIVLNKPTILVNNPCRVEYKTFPPDDYICNRARKAAITVDSFKELLKAINVYKKNPRYLEKEREHYGRILCKYQGVAAKKTVDIMEGLL